MSAQKRNPRILTDKEVQQLLEAVEAAGERDHLLVELPLTTGLRPREVAALRSASIQDGHITVNDKTGSRIVPVGKPLAYRLTAMAAEDGTIWVNGRGDPMTTRAILRLYARAFAQAGIEGPGLGGMVLRHTFATRFMRNGGSIVKLARILGYAWAMRFRHR